MSEKTPSALKWPRACACCLVAAPRRAAEPHPGRSPSTCGDRGEAPYCEACASHVRQHLHAERFRRRGLIWAAMVAVVVAFAAHPAVAVVCFLIMASKISLMNCDRLMQARAGMSRDCACAGPAARRVASANGMTEIVFANGCFEDMFDRLNKPGSYVPQELAVGGNIIRFPGGR